MGENVPSFSMMLAEKTPTSLRMSFPAAVRNEMAVFRSSPLFVRSPVFRIALSRASRMGFGAKPYDCWYLMT